MFRPVKLDLTTRRHNSEDFLMCGNLNITYVDRLNVCKSPYVTEIKNQLPSSSIVSFVDCLMSYLNSCTLNAR
jgi:hypothetical protein